MVLSQLVRQFLIFLGRPFYWILRGVFVVFFNLTSFLPKIKRGKTPKSKRPQVKFPQLTLPSVKLPKITWPKIAFKFRVGWAVKILVLTSISILIGVAVYSYVFKDLPSPDNLVTKSPPQTTHILDRNGVELYKIYASQNRTLVRLSDLPLYVSQSTVAIEDGEFFSHVGFSIKGTLRAFWRNITSGGTVEGGSTITQQLVKTALLSPERTYKRKLREIVLAIAVETKYSKDQILEMYLNRVSYGGTAYGIEEAAQTYFAKSSKNLNLAEAALLAGLPASPTTYSPFGAHPELAKARQQEVLQQMVESKYITWQQAEEAASQKLVFAPQATDIKAPHFVMYVKEQLEKKYGASAVEQGGLTVITTLDWDLQQEAQKIVTDQIAKIAYLHIGNGAALVTQPKTGEILAMVGSKNYFDIEGDGNVNVTLALRQPGSSIKPINYALALMRGFTPASVIDDSPITYRVSGQPPYTPVNYDGRFHGRVPLRIALGSSYNVPAVKILAANGVPAMIELAQKMGISSWSDSSRFGLSLTLGGGEVSMIDMAKVYGVFANSGQKTDLTAILSVKNSKGKVLDDFKTTSDQVIDPKIAYLITDILSDNTARTPAFGPNSDLNIPDFKVAVKTGTTNNLRDNWTIGYTPERLVAVWVGNNDNTPMSYVASGVTGASPIWRAITNYLLKTSPTLGFTSPAELLRVNICTLTGELACSACSNKTEYFVPGTEPKTACSNENIAKIILEKAQKDQESRDQILNGENIGL